MVYTSTSIKEVIARIIRNTRVQDSSYITDMGEWIPEAMGYMRTKVTYQNCWQDITIEFHKGKLPCGVKTVHGAMFNHCRMRWSNSIVPMNTPGQGSTDPLVTVPLGPQGPVDPNSTSIFDTNIAFYAAPDGDGIIYKALLTQLNSCHHCEHTYCTELDYINTSLPDGIIRLFFNRIPLDSDGFPVIPDNESYKEALYWYVRAKMQGAGYTDKLFKEETCMERFEMYAARAIGQIKYPSIDKAELQVLALSRLIMPEIGGYYEHFFANPQEEHLNHRDV